LIFVFLRLLPGFPAPPHSNIDALLMHIYEISTTEQFRKASVGYTMIKLAAKPSRVSSRYWRQSDNEIALRSIPRNLQIKGFEKA